MRKMLILLVLCLFVAPFAHAEVDENAAIDAAVAAICEVYSLDPAAFADGYRYDVSHPGNIWDIGVYPDQGEAYDQMFANSEMPEFVVEIDDATGEAISVAYWGNGFNNDLGTDVSENIDYVAEHQITARFGNNWMEKLFAEEEKRGENISYWPIKDAAAFYQEHVIGPAAAQGIELAEVVHVVPPEGAMGQEEAQKIAEDRLREEYGLTDEDFAQMPVVTQCWQNMGNDTESIVWRFDFLSPTEAENTGMHYLIELDVMDGTVENILDLDLSMGNG